MKLIELNIKTSNKCNYSCSKCFDAMNTEKALFSLDEDITTNFITELTKKYDLERVCLSGGEPMLYKNIWNVFDHSSSLGLKINMQTNGSLITKNLDEILRRNHHNFKLAISIDTLDNNKYDKSTGTKNKLDKMVEGINLLKKNNFENIYVMTVINSLNYDSLKDIYDFVKDLGIKGVTYQPYSPFFFTTFDDQIEYHTEISSNEQLVNSKEISKLEDELITLKNIKINDNDTILNNVEEFENFISYFKNPFELKYKCNNFSILMLNHKGDVKTCWSSDIKIGNIYENNVNEIMNKYESAKKIMQKCEQPCVLKCHTSIIY